MAGLQAIRDALPEAAQKPARLRMNRLAKPRGSCSRWRPAPSTAARSTSARTSRPCARPACPTQMNDAVRIAATMHAAAVALETTGLSTAA